MYLYSLYKNNLNDISYHVNYFIIKYYSILFSRDHFKIHISWNTSFIKNDFFIGKLRILWVLGCVCFGSKSFPEILFWKYGCLVGSENRIFRKLISVDPKKKALTTEMNFRSYFHFKWIPERERERERESEREREKHNQSALFARTKLQSAPFASTSAIDRDPRSRTRLRPDRNRRGASRDRNRRFARSRHRSPSCLRADRDRRFARSRSMARSSYWSLRSTAPSNPVERWAYAKARWRSMARSSYWSLRSTAPPNPVERWASIWVLCLFFWFCLLPCSIFQTPENIFRKIFWNTTKHIKTFSFSENGIFSRNAFMRTKHSLELMTLPFIPLLRKRKIPFEVEFIGMSVSKISTRQMCANSQFYESHPKQPSLVLFSR